MPSEKKTEEEEKRSILFAIAEPGPRGGKKKAAGGALALVFDRLGLGVSGKAAGGTGALWSGFVASKTGFAALLLVGYTGAIGVGMLTSSSGTGQPHQRGVRLFDRVRAERDAAQAAPGAAQTAGAEGESAPGALTSLDYFSRANQDAVGGSSGQDGAVKEEDAEDAPEVSSGVEAPDNRYGASAKRANRASPPRPNFVRSSGISGGSSGSSGAKATAGADLRAGAGSGRYAESGKSASMRSGGGGDGSSRKTMGVGGNSSKAASRQVLQVQKTMRNSLARSNMTSASSGLPYDGGRGRADQIGAGGDSSASGASGVSGIGDTGKPSIVSPNTAENLKEIKPPPKIKRAINKTPYQNLVNMAVIAMAVSMALMFVAGWLKNKADALLISNPPAGMSMMTNVKIAAGLSAAAALTAVYCGARLMQFEGQVMQGLTFIAGGGILAMRAGMILYDSMSAKKAQEEVSVATAGNLTQAKNPVADAGVSAAAAKPDAYGFDKSM